MHSSELAYLRKTGRISRTTFLARFFWLGGIANLLLTAIVYLFFYGSTMIGIYALFLLIILVDIVIYIQAIKRAHDIGKSGWILLIPFYNFIVFFRKGDLVNNQYGSAPDEAPQYASNIIFDQNQGHRSSSKIAAWTGFMFYILTFIFYFWLLNSINNVFTPDPPKPTPIPYDTAVVNPPVSDTKPLPPSVAPQPKDSDNDGVPDSKDRCPNVFGEKSLKGCPNIPVNNSFTHTIKGSSIDQLRQKIKSETAGISIDLSSVNLDLDNISLTYAEGATQIVGLSLFWDTSEGDLSDRIYNKIIPKNSEYTCKVIIDSKYHNGLYHSLLVFVQ